MKLVSSFMKGLAIGIGAIIPGASGGSLAVIFGIYEQITNALANIFKDFKKNLLFFLPIGFGGVVGILTFSRIMNYLFENHDIEVRYIFIGLMIGTFPSIFKQANKSGFRKKYIFNFIVALVITLVFTYIENQRTNIISSNVPGLVQLITYGGIIGFGTIIPGISASFILIYIGAYTMILEAISNVNLTILIPVGIGFILSIFSFAKLINLLFKKAYGYTYYTVLGFVVGSVFHIFPGLEISFRYLIGVLCSIIGFYLSFALSKLAKD